MNIIVATQLSTPTSRPAPPCFQATNLDLAGPGLPGKLHAIMTFMHICMSRCHSHDSER